MKNEKTIVTELKSLSTEFEKHYLLSDGAHRTRYQLNSAQQHHMWGISNKGEKIEIADKISILSTSESSYSYLGFAIDCTAIKKLGVIRSAFLSIFTSGTGENGIFELGDDHITLGKQVGSFGQGSKETLNITSLIQRAGTGVLEFAIKPLSDEYISIEDQTEAINPTLEVDYFSADELVRGQEYFENQVGDSNTCNINILSGYPFVNVPLLNLGGEKFPLSLSLHYDAINKGFIRDLNTGLGDKWYTNYHQFCYKEGSNYVYIDSSCLKHIFELAINSTSLWVDSQGTGLLLKPTSNDKIKIFDENENYLLFDSHGRLVEISQQQTETVNFTNKIYYIGDAKIDTIIDGMGRVVKFFYAKGVSILLDDEEKVSLTIENRNLTKVTKIDFAGGPSVSQFSYNSDNAIASMTSDTDVKLSLKYSNGLIESVYNSQTELTHRFDYDILGTTITSNKQITWIYGFNRQGEFIFCSEKKGSTDKSQTFVDRGQFEQYEGILSQKVLNRFLFDGQESLVIDKNDFNELSIESPLIPVTAASGDNFAIVSMELELQEVEISSNTEREPICIQLIDASDNVLCTIDFEYGPNYQFRAKAFKFQHKRSYDFLKAVVFANLKGKCVLKEVKITPINHAVSSICTNIQTGLWESEYTFEGRRVYAIHHATYSGVNPSTKYKLYASDLFANERNFNTSNGTSWNMWVENKRKLIVNVLNPVIEMGDEFDDIIFSTKNNPRFSAVSVDRETMTADWISHRDDDQISYSIGRKSFVRHIVASYTKGKATENYVQTIYYDKFGRELKAEDFKKTTANTYTSEGYLSASRLMRTEEPSFYILASQKYQDNYLAQRRNYLLDTVAETNMTYDNMGNVITSRAPNGALTKYTYYAYGEKLKRIQESSSYNEINYTDGRLENLEQNSFQYKFTYSGPRISSIRIGQEDNEGIEDVYVNIDYDFTDNQDYITTTYGNGQSVKKTYDKYNRLVTVADESGYTNYVYSDSKTYSFIPNDESSSESKLYVIYDTFTNALTYFTYDDYGNLTRTEINTDSRFLHDYEYDDRQRVNYEEYYFEPKDFYSKLRLNYEYETGNNENQYEINAVTALWNNVYMRYEKQKDDLDRLQSESITIGEYNGHVKEYLYLERTKSETNPDIGTTNYIGSEVFYRKKDGNLQEQSVLSYSYDINRNVSSVSKNNKKIRYTYDSLNQLIREDNPFLNKTFEYSYNRGGNITKKSVGAYTLGAIVPTEVYEYGYSSTFRDRLDSWNGYTNTYDACGNPLTFKGATLTWTRGRLLEQLDNTHEDRIVTFSYSGDGIRKIKNVHTHGKHFLGRHEYVEENGKLLIERFTLQETPPTAYTEKTYFYGPNGIIGANIKNRMYYFVKNMFGDVIQMWDAQNNALVATYEYDAWGNHKVCDGRGFEMTDEDFIGNLNPFRYRGYYWDSDVKMYYLQTRWYDPEIGRFINLDMMEYAEPETINGLNLYAYCLNNPVMGYDPEGTSFWGSVLKVAAAVAIVAATAAVAVATAGTAFGVIAAGAAIGGAVGFVGGGVVSAAEALSEGKSFGEVFDAFADGALTGTITGTVSGAVSASPVNIYGQMLINAAITGTEYIASSLINKKEFNVVEFSLSVVAGIGAGALGGNGTLYTNDVVKSIFMHNIVSQNVIENVARPIIKASTTSVILPFFRRLFS